MAGIAIFDFDGTVIRGDSVVALLLFARKRGWLSLGGLISAGFSGAMYKLHLCSALKAKQRSHAFLKRMPQAERDALLRDFAGTLARRAYPQALEQIARHRKSGDRVVLCSASCACYMQYVASLLQADELLCTPCAADGSVVGPNCRGEEKVRRVQQWLSDQGLGWDAVIAAYGDSGSDAPLLRASGHPVLVNPKGKLRKQLPEARQVVWGQ